MIVSNKDRELHAGQKVNVYRNLNKKNMFSLQDTKSKLVVAYGSNILVVNATFRLSEKSRLKVIENKTRSVHAWINCYFSNSCELDTEGLDELYYNPYYTDCFINRRTGEKLEFVSKVYVDDKGKCWIVQM